MILALMTSATGKEDPELPWLQRISSSELTAPQIAAQINDSCNSHLSPCTVHRSLRESGLHDRIAAKKTLLKDINNKKRLAWPKKHEQWTLDRWRSVLWSDESKFEISGFNRCVFVRQSKWTDDLRMCGSHCEAWRRRCDGALLETLFVIYLEFKAHLTSMTTTPFCSDTLSHLVCA